MVEWEPDDFVAKLGSTRPVQLATGDQIVSFSRGALEGIIEQVGSRFIPMHFEHLMLFPPIGRWYAGEIVRADDGEDDLILRGRLLGRVRPAGPDPDPWRVLATLPTTEAPNAVEIERVNVTARNFETAAFERAKANAPVEVQEEERWSMLPPIEWVVVIAVAWPVVRFTGSFLDTLGRESAEALVRWLRDLSVQAKDGERDRIVTLRFELPDGTVVYGFIPIAAEDDLQLEVIPALDSAGRLAEIAGAQAGARILEDAQQTAFMWKDGEWHLAWSVGGDDVVRVMNWFLVNEPDPSRFLGHPLLPPES